MIDPTTLTKLAFNKLFFPRCNDPVFKTAVMFTNLNPISLSCQEFLFFAHHDSVFNGINFLSFAEMYNETHKSITALMTDLQSVQDESDWYFNRSKICTRFGMFNEGISSTIQNSIEKKKPFASHDQQVHLELQNATILWNNAITMIRKNYQYTPEKNTQIWELWKTLKQYYEKDVDNIVPNPSLIQEYQRTMHYRLNNDFFKKHYLSYEKNSHEVQAINIVQEALNTMMLKKDIESSMPLSDSFMNKVKNVLKI